MTTPAVGTEQLLAIPEVSVSELVPAGADCDSVLMGFTAASWIAVYRKHGPVFRLQEFGKVFACGAAASREIWKHGDDWSYADTSLGQIFQSELGKQYITASDGDYHRYQRRLLRPLFNGESIYRHLSGIDAVLAAGLQDMSGQQFDLHDLLIFLYTKGLNRTMVVNDASDVLIRRFARFEEEFIRGGLLQGEARAAWYARPDYVELRADVMGFFRQLISRRLSGERKEDNLDRLLDVMKQQHNGVLDADEILRDAYLMQAAGAGNMAGLCCTLLWLLMGNENLYTQLRDEFRQLDPRQMLKSGIAGMPFTRNFMLETERRYPVTPGMLKLAVRDLELVGYRIPAQTEIVHFFVLAHFLEENYEDAFAFKPERWAEGKLTRPHAFGGGEHVCIGQNLSYLFIVMTLRLLLADHSVAAARAPYLKPVNDEPGSPLRVAFDVALDC
ncbi:MAG: cytochrome P450 [Pseudomonadota bacterium]